MDLERGAHPVHVGIDHAHKVIVASARQAPQTNGMMHNIVKEAIPDFEFNLDDPSTLDAGKATASSAGVPDMRKLIMVE